MNTAAIVLGAVVFGAAQLEHVPLATWIFKNEVGLTAVVSAALSLVLLWYLLLKGKTKVLRLLAGFQVSMILLAISYAHYPNFIRLKNGTAVVKTFHLERHKFQLALLTQIELSAFFQGIALAILILAAILKGFNLLLAA